MHNAAYSPVQCAYTMQASTRPVHSDWLSGHNNTKNKDQGIAGMSISIHTISIEIVVLVCTSREDIRTAMSKDAELQMLKTHIIRGWPQNKDDLEPSLDGYWPIRHDLAMMNSVTMKGEKIIIPFSLQK